MLTARPPRLKAARAGPGLDAYGVIPYITWTQEGRNVPVECSHPHPRQNGGAQGGAHASPGRGANPGGSGREISRVVELAYERLRPGGRLVANVGSIESLSAVHGALVRAAKDVNVWMINVARGNYQLERVRFEAINPSFLVAATKPK